MSSASAFSRAAERYDRFALHQHQVRERLVDLAAPYLRHVPKGGWIADAGCGTGLLYDCLKKSHIDAEMFTFDVSEAMCRLAKKNNDITVCSSIALLPVRSGILHGVLSNLVLQWCGGLNQTFIQFYRALRPGGVLAFSLYVKGTLATLERSFLQTDGKMRMLDFHDAEAVCTSVTDAGFELVHREENRHTRIDDDLYGLLRYFGRIGANGIARAQSDKGMLTPRWLTRLKANYPERNGKIASEWVVLYVVARKPE